MKWRHPVFSDSPFVDLGRLPGMYIECNDVDVPGRLPGSRRGILKYWMPLMNCVAHRVGSSLAQTRNVLKRIIECLRTSNIVYTYPVISVQTLK